MNDLFTVTFGADENFKATLNHPLWITSNPYKLKEEVKRGLLEIVDTHNKLSLAYSGGSDSGFILCCLHDLIKEGKLKKDTIEVFQGVFIINDELPYDMNRAIKFANSLGFDPRIVEINLDKDTDVWTNLWDQSVKFIETHGGRQFTLQDIFPLTVQNYLMDIQDSVVISGYLSSKRIGYNNWDVSLLMLEHYHPDSNHVDVLSWNNKIVSSFFSPFKFKKNLINTEPFKKPVTKKWLTHPLYPSRFDNDFPKLLIYLQCYPEMNEILYKFKTLGYVDGNFGSGDYEFFERGLPSRYGKETKTTLKIFEFKKFFSSYSPRSANVTLPSGELYTIEHLTNYKDYFVEENDE